MKKSSYLSERVYDAIPSEINMESLEYWKKILKEEGLQYVKKNHLEYFFGLILSILVDTFISKISLTMQPGPKIDSISGA